VLVPPNASFDSELKDRIVSPAAGNAPVNLTAALISPVPVPAAKAKEWPRLLVSLRLELVLLSRKVYEQSEVTVAVTEIAMIPSLKKYYISSVFCSYTIVLSENAAAANCTPKGQCVA
jgi:hypothetical protein